MRRLILAAVVRVVVGVLGVTGVLVVAAVGVDGGYIVGGGLLLEKWCDGDVM